MTRTTLALLLVLALSGCRLLEQTRQSAANALAAAVVRSMFELQSSALDGPSSRPPLNRPATLLALSPPAAAAAVVNVTAPATVPKTIAAVAPSRCPLTAPRTLTVCLKRGTSLQRLAPQLQLLAPQLQHALQLCKTEVVIRLDENGNTSL
jgi:hypothetical protein